MKRSKSTGSTINTGEKFKNTPQITNNNGIQYFLIDSEDKEFRKCSGSSLTTCLYKLGRGGRILYKTAKI
jgi:hypothetical protein